VTILSKAISQSEQKRGAEEGLVKKVRKKRLGAGNR